MTFTPNENIKAFLHDLASSCSGCLRRGQGFCETCAASRAKRLLDEITTSAERGATPKLELSYVERYAKILSIVRSSPRPLAAREIDLRDYCSKKLKYWTLRRLVSMGRLQMIFDGREYLFRISKHKKGKNNGSNTRTEEENRPGRHDRPAHR